MKVKTKGITLSVLAILFIVMMGLLFGLLGSGGTTVASADSITNLYNVYFDYNYYTGVYESTCNTLKESETHVLSSTKCKYELSKKYLKSGKKWRQYFYQLNTTKPYAFGMGFCYWTRVVRPCAA